MHETNSAPALQFEGLTFNLVEHTAGQPWLRHHEISEALGHQDPRSILNIYNSNATEFTDSMTALVKLPTAGGVQEVRIFSLRGAHLLGMFARTERAAEFRRWVLDVLEQQTVTQPYPATVQRAVQRLMLQGEALRRQLLAGNPKFRLVVKYHQMPGLTHEEKARLMGLKTAHSWRDLLHQAVEMGLIDWAPDPGRVAAGRAGIKALHDHTRAKKGAKA